MGEPRCVLVVDDEPLVLASMTRLRRRHSFRVEVADNGQEGLEKAIALQPDWIVSDVRMPVVDGPAMVRALRERGLPGVRIAFLSGYNDLAPVEIEALGIDAMLTKPISSAELLAVLGVGTAGASE